MIPKMSKLPVLYTLEHASHNFGNFGNRIALTDIERFRFSDYGVLETVPRHTEILSAEYSRGLIDLNRAPDAYDLFPEYDFSNPPNPIWKKDREPTDKERDFIRKNIYETYQKSILDKIRSFSKRCIIISWHNTAHYKIEGKMMAPIILSNLGDAGSASSKTDNTSCSPELLISLAASLSKELKHNNLPHDVALNYIFKGGYVTEHYNTRRHPEIAPGKDIDSIQVEYDTIITHDQNTLKPIQGNIAKLRESFTKAMESVCSNF